MNKRNIILIISILAFIVIIGGVSYSYFVYSKKVGDISLNTGDISINLSGVNGNQTLSNVVPLSDFDGKNGSSYFDFTVNATVDTERIYYEVYILPDSSSTLNIDYLKTYLTDQTNVQIEDAKLYNNLSFSEIENGRVVYKGIIETNQDKSVRTETKDFRLRMWIDEDYTEITSKTFDFDIYLYAKNVSDDYQIPIDPCPGCHYLYTSEAMYTKWNMAGGTSGNHIPVTPTVLTSGIYKNYQDLVTSIGRYYFLGVRLDTSNEVIDAYSCGLYGGEVPFCIKGSLSSSYGGTDSLSIYMDNTTLMQSANLYNNTCSVTVNEYHATDCGPWDATPVSSHAYSSGLVGVGVSGAGCAVYSAGDFKCSPLS
jgi:hypothetical protein